jgi:hypothetical protein
LLVIDIDFLIYTKKRGLHTIRSLTAFGLQLPLLMNEQSQTPRIDMIDEQPNVIYKDAAPTRAYPEWRHTMLVLQENFQDCSLKACSTNVC